MKLLKDHEKIEKDIRLNGQIQLKRKLSNVSQKCNCIFWHPLSLLRRFRMTLGRFGKDSERSLYSGCNHMGTVRSRAVLAWHLLHTD